MTKMSVTRALAELKRLDDSILRASSDGVFVAVGVGKDTNQTVSGLSGTSVAQITAKIQGSYDSLTTMFKQRSDIKRAIVLSNAKTMVKLGAVELTVAEAIEMKRSVESKRSLLAVLKRASTVAQNSVTQLNTALDAAIEANLKAVYGSDKAKMDADAHAMISKPQKALKEASLIDPMKISKKIAQLEEEISLVDTELDFTLSEVNAKTDIEV
jgi:hypothetical protein